MGWIDVNEMMPPEGLEVLLEVSGFFTNTNCSERANHGFFIGSWIVPEGTNEGEWLIWDSCSEENSHFIDPEVHAWMPLPKHFGADEGWSNPHEEDMMEHAMFEDDPEWLYKGDCVYEQMSLEDFLGGQKE